MATIRAYATIEQSRKLVEILPLESADMYYECTKEEPQYKVYVGGNIAITYNLFSYRNGYTIPCWSLAALLGVLPNNKHITTTLSRGGWKIEPVEYIDKWFCEYEDEVDEDSPSKNFSVSADNPIDACVAMIERLHELKML